MKKPLLLRPLLLALALVTPACLENEEEITVRPDGSAHVRVSAKGDVADLAQGYPVPFGGPWQPASGDAREWLAKVGAATGGKGPLESIQDEVLGKPDTERRLEVEAELASLQELPARFADPHDPYAEAYLERSTSLQVQKRGRRTVYVFERTFHARPYGRDILARSEKEEEGHHDEFLDKLHAGTLTEQDWQATSEHLVEIHRNLARTFVHEALVGFYTRGSASLSASALQLALERLDAGMAEAFSVPRLMALPQDDAGLDAAWTRMYDEFRDAIRSEVARTLADAGVAREEQNAVAFALEREFTTYDHSMDLADESFALSVTLPGELVTGNYTSEEDTEPTAHWKISGFELLAGDVTLRAVSVVE